jgi:hypothetical protein
MALFSRQAVQFKRFSLVLGNSFAIIVEQAEAVLSVPVTLISGFFKPFSRFLHVLGYSYAIRAQ